MPDDEKLAMSSTDGLKKLREPFPAGSVGKLPRGGIQLDYVGHAVVTDRLLEVDPLWSWEPFAVDSYGLPAYDERGNLWIRLTVLGVTRIGVGDGPDPKQRISDALRNAAMRFGVALDLWSKDELESGFANERPAEQPREHDQRPVQRSEAPSDGRATEKQVGMIQGLFRDLGLTDRQAKHDYTERIVGREITTLVELTKSEASTVIEKMQEDIKSPSWTDA